MLGLHRRTQGFISTSNLISAVLRVVRERARNGRQRQLARDGTDLRLLSVRREQTDEVRIRWVDGTRRRLARLMLLPCPSVANGGSLVRQFRVVQSIEEWDDFRSELGNCCRAVSLLWWEMGKHCIVFGVDVHDHQDLLS